VEKTAAFTLTAEDLGRFVKSFSRDDTFTVLYVLTKAEKPRTIGELCRQYGASPIEMKDRLERLRALGLIGEKGGGYLASARAVIAMRSLEERLGKRQLSNATSVTGAVEGSSMVVPVNVATESHAASVMDGTTNNGGSFSVRLTATASGPLEARSSTTETANEDTSTPVSDLPKQSNAATRSQYYM